VYLRFRSKYSAKENDTNVPEDEKSFGKYFHNGKISLNGRCYDHNFLRFLTIFGEKIGVFLINQSYDQFFA
jgi:hypothetical protein